MSDRTIFLVTGRFRIPLNKNLTRLGSLFTFRRAVFHIRPDLGPLFTPRERALAYRTDFRWQILFASAHRTLLVNDGNSRNSNQATW
jgi:hypothetical protein